MRRSVLLLLIGLVGLSQLRSNGVTAAQAPQAPFSTKATAIVVDVVVRDRKGAPVLDLRPDEFELFEDDARQTIGAVELVTPDRLSGLPKTPSASDGSPRVDPPPNASGSIAGPTLVALAFHRLTPEARALAHRAAQTYLELGVRPSDFAGVFLIDTGLETLQTYTNDRAKLRAAIDAVAARATSVYARQAMGPAGSAGGDGNAAVSPTAGAESPGRPTGNPGTTFEDPRAPRGVNEMLQKMAEKMEESYGALMRERDGHLESDALMALVTSLGLLPGRKTVVFFSEGMAIPVAIQPRFRRLIATANRANVSIYTLDAAGLRVHSDQLTTSRALHGVAGTTFNEGGSLRELEKNESLLQQDPRVGLETLARETGGFLINNTNDLPGAFRRVDADRRFHYLLTYSPQRPDLDGRFRRIRVAVRRPGMDVRARSGYVASSLLGTLPSLTFETAPLAALDRTPRPTDIGIAGTAFRFPVPGRPTRVALLVTVPPDQLTYKVDERSTTYSADFAILTRVLDGSGQTVRKGSQPFLLSGPAKEVERDRKGAILFYRQPELPPGRYVLEYAVHDGIRGVSGTGSSEFVIDDTPAERLAVSDLVVVARVERADGADHTNPLTVGDLLLYPAMGPISKASSNTLTFFYTAYTHGRSAGGMLELRQGDRSLATIPVTPPAPDSNGRVQHVARIPISALGEGRYELRLSINDGLTEQVRSAEFALVP